MIGAAVFGGPLGMASYLMSTKYIGPSYSASISILYPVLGALIAKFLFNENLNKYSSFNLFKYNWTTYIMFNI